uniref:Cytochrome P450 n=1 Tax=Graphocephala atropunctata TaxID=36148 RepID=A0A1B6MN44_9HEMI
MIINDSFLVDILIATATLLGLFYYFITSTYDHWEKRGIPYVKPTLVFGNLKDQFLLKKSLNYVLQDIYNSFPGQKYGGYFESRSPVLMIRDPELMERILVKDFSYFINRDFPSNIKRDPLSGNLFSLKGDVWRNLRNKLTPTFTTGKLKGMIEQICNSGNELLNLIEKSTMSNEGVDAKKMGAVFGIDVIASCAFGLQFKHDSPEGIEFRKIVDKMFAPSITQTLRMCIMMFCYPLAKLLGIKNAPKQVNDYIIELVKSTMEFRKKNNIQRNDFLQLMMNLRAQEEEGKEINWKKELSEEDAYLNHLDYVPSNGQHEKGFKVMTDECIAAQSFVFLTGGSETTSTAIAFNLYELAVNPQVQTKLQQEVDSVLEKNGGKLTYQSLKEMTYMDLVIQETNRKYALGGFLRRVSNAPYRIPGTDIVLEEGTKVTIPLLAIHNDPANFPEPDKFIPERFEGNNHRTNGNKYLAFGDGPRVCIAMRFVILELKACLAMVISKYSVTLDPRTEVPLRFLAKAIMLTPCGGIWVRFQQRERMQY